MFEKLSFLIKDSLKLYSFSYLFSWVQWMLKLLKDLVYIYIKSSFKCLTFLFTNFSIRLSLINAYNTTNSPFSTMRRRNRPILSFTLRGRTLWFFIRTASSTRTLKSCILATTELSNSWRTALFWRPTNLIWPTLLGYQDLLLRY